MIPYPSEVEAEMKKFFETLSEKDKRGYAVVETLKFGLGGLKYIVQVSMIWFSSSSWRFLSDRVKNFFCFARVGLPIT